VINYHSKNSTSAKISVSFNGDQRQYRIPLYFYLKLIEVKPPYIRSMNMFLLKILLEHFKSDPLQGIDNLCTSHGVQSTDVVTWLVYDYLKKDGVELFG